MPTILVVDDSPVDRKLVRGLLTRQGEFEVDLAVDGKDALEHLRRAVPQLVLTDLIMPEMDGLELVAQVVKEFPLVPVILMTGKGSEEIAVKALKAGAASYVPKSQMADHLVETVENVLRAAQEGLSLARLMESLDRSEFFFVLENDASLMSPLINFIHQHLRTVGLCTESNVVRICVALEEALNNAVFHGNLGLSSDLREGDRPAYLRLIDERRRVEPYSSRRVRVEVRVTRNEAVFVIRDEGDGFDPHSLPDPRDPANLEKISGRGLLLMRTFMDEVTFNPTGNQVTMIKRNPAA